MYLSWLILLKKVAIAHHIYAGLATTLGSQVLLLTVLLATTIHFMRLNKQMREGKIGKPLEGQPGFYYTL